MRNLEAEMKRYGISTYDIQQTLMCTNRTVKNKGSSNFVVDSP